jgi:hypothetical protein
MTAFELFVLPIDPEVLIELLQAGCRNQLGSLLFADDPPIVCLYRKSPPSDGLRPNADFERCLHALPIWYSKTENSNGMDRTKDGSGWRSDGPVPYLAMGS